MSKLCPSTFFCAFSMARLMRPCSIGTSSSIPSRSMSPVMRSAPKMRIRSSSERQVEARAARVALAAGAAAQLVVDAARLVPLGAEDVQTARGQHLHLLRVALGLELLEGLLVGGLLLGRQLVPGLAGVLRIDLGARHELGVAAEDDVGPAAGHVGRDGDRALAPRLRDDERLALVLLGVQDGVLDPLLAQERGDDLGLLDADGADQHRLAALVAVLDLVADRAELAALVLVDDVVGVLAQDRLVGRDDRDVELVDLVELLRLGVGGAGHAGQLVVEAEVVLIADRRHRLVLFLDLDAFLGLDRLVQAVRPAAPRHLPAGELVDDDDLAFVDEVVDVALVERVRLQRL